jgi:hypothetical protein
MENPSSMCTSEPGVVHALSEPVPFRLSGILLFLLFNGPLIVCSLLRTSVLLLDLPFWAFEIERWD